MQIKPTTPAIHFYDCNKINFIFCNVREKFIFATICQVKASQIQVTWSLARNYKDQLDNKAHILEHMCNIADMNTSKFIGHDN